MVFAFLKEAPENCSILDSHGEYNGYGNYGEYGRGSYGARGRDMRYRGTRTAMMGVRNGR